jgi:hypothetical protein
MRDKHIPVTAQIVVNEDEFFCPVGLSLSPSSLCLPDPRGGVSLPRGRQHEIQGGCFCLVRAWQKREGVGGT